MIEFAIFILLISILAIICLNNVEAFFLNFNFDKHPKLDAYLYSVLSKICTDEKIGLFFVNYEEVNKDNINDEPEAVGKYYYLLDQKAYTEYNKILSEIIKIEAEYNTTYEDLCLMHGYKVFSKMDLTYPRILIANNIGKKSIYGVLLHEIGHHFAVKEKGKNHNELDADRHAVKIIDDYLPFFIKAIYEIRFDIKMHFGKELKAIISYFIFKLWHKNSL